MSFGISFQNMNLPFLGGIGLNSFNPSSNDPSVFNNASYPNELKPPYSLDFMNEFWNNQKQLQAMFFAVLMSMAESVPHVSENNRVVPFDSSKYNVQLSKTNEEKIAELKPQMQEKTVSLIKYAKEVLKKDIKINSGYRSPEEQAYLRQKTPHLAAKKSLHCEGLAVDLNIVGGSDEDYQKLGDYAHQLGMRWGGSDFKNMKERWHFDMGWDSV